MLPWLILFGVLAVGFVVAQRPSVPRLARLDQSPELGSGRALAVWAAFYGCIVVCTITISLLIATINVIQGGDVERFKRLEGSIVPTPSLLLSYVLAALLLPRLLKSVLGGVSWTGVVRRVSGPVGSLRTNLFAAALGLGIAAFFIRLGPHFGPPPRPIVHSPVRILLIDTGWRRFMWALTAVLLAPPVEEFVFRGVLLEGISRSFGVVASGVVVTVLFVAGHLLSSRLWLPAMASIATAAVAALGIRLWTKSLVPAVALHAAYNFGLVVSIYAATWTMRS